MFILEILSFFFCISIYLLESHPCHICLLGECKLATKVFFSVCMCLAQSSPLLTWPYDFPWTIKQNKWKVLVHKVTLSYCWEPFSYMWMSPCKNSEGGRTEGERFQLSSHSSSLSHYTHWLQRSAKWVQAGHNTQIHHRIRDKCIIIGFISALWSVFLRNKIWLMLLSLWYLVI